MKSRNHRVFAHALAAVLTAASVSTATPNDWVGDASRAAAVRLAEFLERIHEGSCHHE